MIPGGVNELLLRSAAAGGATAGRSVRFNSADSAYLSRATWGTPTNRKKGTLSLWIKRAALGTSPYLVYSYDGSANNSFGIYFDSGDALVFQFGGSSAQAISTAAVFRDPSAWYHIVLAWDTTDGTTSNRAKIYVNNVLQTLNATSYPALNAESQFPSTSSNFIGFNSTATFNGYLALVHFIDGQALTPSSFGETSATTGQWIAKTYSGSYGTNGFFLDFSDNSAATATTLGKDKAGSNNWTPNNLSVTAGSGNDSLRDHPTSAGTSTGLGGEVSGNYCTWNPLNSSTYTFANGNLEATGYAGNSQMVSTIGVSSGKWYCEITFSGSGGTSNAGIGISKGEQGTYPGELSTSYGYFGSASKINAGSVTSYGATYTYGDIIGIALDMDAGTCTMYKNGSSQGQLASGLSGTYFIAVRNSSNAGDKTIANFGQRAFAYTAPSGFSPLVDTLLPTPTIAKPNTVMDAVTYTGTGSSNTITLPGSFNPDFIWIKRRSAASDHVLMDVVRGFGSANTKVLYSNLANTEATTSVITSTSSTGFTIGGSGIETNANGSTYVAWTWDAGSSNATNTSGTITSTCRTNISAGFSVVSYTGNGTAGATVGHSLGVAPQFIAVKNRSAGENWRLYHVSLGATKSLGFNTNAATTSSNRWNDTSPTSTLITLGDDNGVNQNISNIIAYCWTPVAGYSAFGSYTGSTSKPFVYLGFRPKVVWIKGITSNAYTSYMSWYISDSARDTDNPQNGTGILWANRSDAEGNRGDGTAGGSFLDVDFLSNGFRILDTTSVAELNYTGATYIYCAWAEAPFPYARAR